MHACVVCVCGGGGCCCFPVNFIFSDRCTCTIKGGPGNEAIKKIVLSEHCAYEIQNSNFYMLNKQV